VASPKSPGICPLPLPPPRRRPLLSFSPFPSTYANNCPRTNGTPDICSGFTIIIVGTSSPCGIDFFVDGGNGPFTLQGCGGAGLSLERTQEFNSNCVFESKLVACSDGAVVGVDGRRKC